MSLKGIKKAAEAFSFLQQTRHELMAMGTKESGYDNQDIRLAQLMELGKDAMRQKFTEITLEKN